MRNWRRLTLRAGKEPCLCRGSKRVAFLAIGVFLSINGLKLVADQVDAIQTMLAVAASEVDEAGLAAWIQKNSAPK